MRTFLSRFMLVLALLTAAGKSLPAAGDPEKAAAAAKSFVSGNQHRLVRELVDFLSIPNVSEDLPNVQRNASHLAELMRQRGVETRILEMEVAPLVYGEIRVPEARHTLLFYCHYDGDPVDASRWKLNKPFEPVLVDNSLQAGGVQIAFPDESTPYQEDWRIYARSASDDKSPIVALMAAVEALRESAVQFGANLKFLFEGEEEISSPHLGEFLNKYRDLLEADLVIFADGPIYPSGQPTLFFGVRGVARMDITVYGPARPLHSGHYGNWAPNPVLMLSQLLSTLKDDQGRVLVDGFYDDMEPLSDLEEQALNEIPSIESDLKVDLGLGATEGEAESLPRSITRPSLNVHGFESGWVGPQARNIIPSEARASIDLRLVKGIEPQRQIRRVVEHIRAQDFHVVDQEPDHQTRLRHRRVARVLTNAGYPALRTPMDLPLARQLAAAVESAAGRTVKLPTMGGSVPLYLFSDRLNIPVIGLPTVNPDNNQHSPNENLRLGNFFKAVEVFAAVMAM